MSEPDTKLLQLEAEFIAADDRWKKASDKVETLHEERERITKRILKAERDEAKQTDKTGRLVEKILQTQAESLAGLHVKVKVRERVNTDDVEHEIEFLESLVADIRTMVNQHP